MRVFDCFPYWREHNHLAARRELWDTHPHIDVTVIAMVGTHTHSGHPIVSDDRVRSGYEPNVVTFDIDLGDPNLDPWTRERRQRNALAVNINRLASGDDLIIVADADEIVDPAMIPVIRQECVTHGPVSLGMTLLYYSLDWASPVAWTQGKAFLRHQMPADLSTCRVDTTRPAVMNAGWHISWQGGEDSRAVKATSFAHTEFSSDEAIAGIQQAAADGRDPHGNKLVPFDRATLPAAILRHLS